MDECKLFDEIVKSRVEQHDRTKKLMLYVVILFCFMVMFSTIMTTVAVVSNNETIKEVELRHAETIKAVESQHGDTIRELWRTYFDTDYDYGDIQQTIEIGGKQ